MVDWHAPRASPCPLPCLLLALDAADQTRFEPRLPSNQGPMRQQTKPSPSGGHGRGDTVQETASGPLGTTWTVGAVWPCDRVEPCRGSQLTGNPLCLEGEIHVDFTIAKHVFPVSSSRRPCRGERVAHPHRGVSPCRSCRRNCCCSRPRSSQCCTEALPERRQQLLVLGVHGQDEALDVDVAFVHLPNGCHGRSSCASAHEPSAARL